MISLFIFFPLFSSICVGFWGFKLGTKGTVVITIYSLLSSTLLWIYILLTVGFSLNPTYIKLLHWIQLESFSIYWALCFDNLAILMFGLVIIVSNLVYFYSLVYMFNDPHLIRFSCYLTLFTFFMLILIASENLLQLFFGWEGVGLCSYLLINFWYTRVQANKSAIQAIMINKLGDITVLLAIIICFGIYFSVDFSTLFLLTPYLSNSTLSLFSVRIFNITIITFLLFIGVLGKSAQIGLHTWLPSAMEGPTPVSALIHAATMVTAGIFLIIRCSFLFEYSSPILLLLTLSGALTTFFASTVGLLQNDIKRVIAYSTCSQLGYMAFSCGISNYTAAIFHLINHGFFKALLFLSAGSIIHGFSDEQDLRKMGSLKQLFPITYCVFLIGSLALMGFPFLSGFFSKDIILEIAFSSYTISGLFAYWVGSISAFFTSFYSFRLLYLTFLSPINSFKVNIKNAHESSSLIIFVLSILSFGSIFSGFFLKEFFVGVGSIFLGNSIFIIFKHFTYFEAEFLPIFIKIIPLLFSFSGVYLSLLLYNSYPSFLVYLKNYWFPVLYSFFNQKWFFDKIYNFYIFKPFFYFSYLIPFRLFDKGFIELFGPLGLIVILRAISKVWSNIHTGLIYHYTFWILLSILLYINLSFFFTFIYTYFSFEILVYYIFIITLNL